MIDRSQQCLSSLNLRLCKATKATEQKVLNKMRIHPIRNRNREQSSAHLFSKKGVGTSTKREAGFPLIALSMFLLSNIPTGACLWWVGNSQFIAIDAWSFVFTGAFSTTMVGAGAGAWVRAITGSGAWVWAGVWAIAWAVVQALAGPWALAWSVAGFGAVIWVGAWLELTVSFSWAWAVAGAIAWVGAGTWTQIKARAANGVRYWAGAVVGLEAVAVAGAGALSAYWAGADARDVGAKWAGVGGIATTQAGVIVGLSTALIDSGVQSLIVAALGLLQIAFMLKSLKPIAQSLPTHFRSTIQPFTILNVACILGMLCGASLAWALSFMSSAA